MDWIPAKLRLIRQGFNMTQLEMAQASGLSQRDISQLENGRKEGLPKEFIHFLHNQGVDLNWLFTAPALNADPVPETSALIKKYASLEDQLLSSVAQEGNALGYGPAKQAGALLATPAIALVDAAAQQHYPARLADPAFEQLFPHFTLPLSQVQQGLFRGFEVTTDELQPAWAAHDWAIARLESLGKVENGALYVVVTKERVQVQHVFLTEAHPAMLLLKAQQTDTAGAEVAVETIKELWSVQGRLSFQLPTPGAAPELKVAGLEARLTDLLDRVQRLEQGR